MRKVLLLTAAMLTAGAAPAAAHPFHGLVGLTGGLIHPLTGIDHLLAMTAVGLLAVKIGGKALIALPALFVSLMIVGGAAGVSGMGSPWTEQAIMASLVVLGGLVSLRQNLGMAIVVPLVAVFAFFHGMAHGSEMPVDGALSFAAGALLSTVALHGLGIALGMAAARLRKRSLVEVGGLAVAAVGGAMMLGAI